MQLHINKYSTHCEIYQKDKNRKCLVKMNDKVWGNLKLWTKCSFYIKLKIYSSSR